MFWVKTEALVSVQVCGGVHGGQIFHGDAALISTGTLSRAGACTGLDGLRTRSGVARPVLPDARERAPHCLRFQLPRAWTGLPL